jgi:transposase
MDQGRSAVPRDAECEEGLKALHQRTAELTGPLARRQEGPQGSSASPATEEATSLPQGIAACHVLIAELSSSISELHDDKVELTRENEELKLTITRLLLQLQGHRRERFVDDPNQTKLDLGDDPEAQEALAEAVAEAEKIVQEYAARRTLKPQRPRNEKLPDHLERYEVTLPVPEEVATCPEHGPRKQIGEDRIETLEFQRPKLRVRVTVMPKFACEHEPYCGVKEPERPLGLVEGNRYDTSVAAEVLAAKYFYHLPVYRQQDWFAGCGWTPGRSTLLNLLESTAFVLEPLADHYRRLVLGSPILGTDDTTLTLLLPPVIPGPKAGDPRSLRIHEVFTRARAEGRASVTSRMWAYRAVEIPVNVFDFTVSHHRDGPDAFLQDYRGKLMADCYSGYQGIELRSESRIQRGACWSHARRKVFDGRGSHPLEASFVLAMIGELYDIEECGKTLSAERRLALRQREARPVLNRLRAWLDGEAAARVLPKSLFAEAVRYLRNHWAALNLYLSDGRCPIDNNDTEQLMKQVALGRKNWLFLGSVAAGYRTATFLTIVSTAHRNDLDVWAYVKDVLDQLLAGSTDYHALQADVWKQSHPEQVRAYRAEERRDRADAKRARRARRRLLAQARSP